MFLFIFAFQLTTTTLRAISLATVGLPRMTDIRQVERHMNALGNNLRLHYIGIVARDEVQIEECKLMLGLEEVARETIEKYYVTSVHK